MPFTGRRRATKFHIIMKKTILLLFSLILSVSVYAESVSFDDLDKLCEKIQKQLDKQPKDCGVAEIDKYVNSAKDVGVSATSAAIQIKELYNGADSKNLASWMSLADNLKTQLEATKAMAEAAKDAAGAVKSMPPTKAIGAGKSVKWGGEMTKNATEAITKEAKIVADVISSLK